MLQQEMSDYPEVYIISFKSTQSIANLLQELFLKRLQARSIHCQPFLRRLQARSTPCQPLSPAWKQMVLLSAVTQQQPRRMSPLLKPSRTSIRAFLMVLLISMLLPRLPKTKLSFWQLLRTNTWISCKVSSIPGTHGFKSTRSNLFAVTRESMSARCSHCQGASVQR